jgi:5-hydroxyisourate hydrolase
MRGGCEMLDRGMKSIDLRSNPAPRRRRLVEWGAVTAGGGLTTHVLDVARGRPAAGVAIELVRVAGDGSEELAARAVTNADGRTDAPLVAPGALTAGTYELRFAVGDYLRAAGHAVSDPPFLDVVPVRFGVGEPGEHHHVPLLVSPWSYSTYRGS